MVSSRNLPKADVPFRRDVQLDESLNDWQHELFPPDQQRALPGLPRIKLWAQQEVLTFLEQDLRSERLEAMAANLWLMSTYSSVNVTPLHRQSLRGRQIMVMEDPGLHLVWNHDRIFIKPIPRYLLCHAFWEAYLRDTQDGHKNLSSFESRKTRIAHAARGFLRTYFYLIQHESDFRIAQRQDLHLIPSHVTWDQFCNFSETFNAIKDEDVSPRYEYGELRLSRLNLWALPLLRQRFYQDLGLQYSDYFARYFAPLLFMFAALSVLLSAMQVGIAAESVNSLGWAAFGNASRWFAVVSIGITVAPVSIVLGLFLFRFVDEWVYALRKRYQRGRHAKPGLLSHV